MKGKRILITLTSAELQEMDEFCEWLGCSRSRFIENALMLSFSALSKVYLGRADRKAS